MSEAESNAQELALAEERRETRRHLKIGEFDPMFNPAPAAPSEPEVDPTLKAAREAKQQREQAAADDEAYRALFDQQNADWGITSDSMTITEVKVALGVEKGTPQQEKEREIAKQDEAWENASLQEKESALNATAKEQTIKSLVEGGGYFGWSQQRVTEAIEAHNLDRNVIETLAENWRQKGGR